MCTAIAFSGLNRYFGRNLDLDFSYDEKITIVPRCFSFSFGNGMELKEHYAMIGVSYVRNGYPLFYDAVNEKGLAVAGLRFPQNAVYHSYCKEKENLATFELIPGILSQCSDVKEATACLKKINLLSDSFDADLPSSELHWMFSDSNSSIVVEPSESGLSIFRNPVEILTNNPPFEMQMTLLEEYNTLTPYETKQQPYSLGLGGMGLPGDYSSRSRFSKAYYVKQHSICEPWEEIGQVFHILKSVEQPKGCVRLQNGGLEKTIYSSCCDMRKGIYYYTTYENSQISAVSLKKEELDGTELICYSLIREQQIKQVQKK